MAQISLGSRVKKAWNAFFNKDPTGYMNYGPAYSYRPDRFVLSRRNERTIVAAIYNKIAADASTIDIKHVQLDKNGRYEKDIDSSLNTCLTLEANLDQTGRAFMQDVVMSMLDEGVVAIVPIETDEDPTVGETGSYDIYSVRVGKIVEWYPDSVKIQCYDERDGQKKERVWPKRFCAIIENPFYAVMNERNSTMQRLVRKLALLDAVDEQAGSGKLDLLVQLPYVVKTDKRREQAETRRKDIEEQLAGSKYGIAYIDATEHVTQLNRSVENNLMSQIEYLTSMLYSQLGITQAILDGTADEKAMLNYYNRTIEPILSAIADEMKRKFLTSNARTRGQSIKFFRDNFKLMSMSQISEVADKLTSAEVVSSNEVRQVIGLPPSKQKGADDLRNRKLSKSNVELENEASQSNEEEEIQNG